MTLQWANRDNGIETPRSEVVKHELTQPMQKGVYVSGVCRGMGYDQSGRIDIC